MVFLTAPVPVERTFISTLFAAIDALHSKPHAGLDMAVPVGTTIIAPAHGRVTRIFSQPTGGGDVLEITHDDGLKTVYMHLSKYFVSIGNEVQIGQPVALSGGAKGAPGAGDSSGPHLHFEVRSPSGQALDPLEFLPGAWTLSTNLAAKLGQRTIDGAKSLAKALFTPTNIFLGVAAFVFWKYYLKAR